MAQSGIGTAEREAAPHRYAVTRRAPPSAPPKLKTVGLNFYYGRFQALRDINLAIPERRITALIGPSGCGKSTLIRVFNRMYDLVPGTRVEGSVQLDGEEVTTAGDLLELRRKVGMVFQRPTAFPMSVFDNVAFAPRLLGWEKAKVEEVVERSLRDAALWDEVSGRLSAAASELSGGQLQRLSIARCLAVNPEVILMDEPCSALDPVATNKIEDLMGRLSEQYTIAIVTHNMQQAARVSDFSAFMLMDPQTRHGELVEFAPTEVLFNRPSDPRTEASITGRFG
jgi:phosphate transport system ATP-binding protein